MTTRLLQAAAASAALLIAAGCNSAAENAAASNDVIWDTLSSGGVRAVYSSFPVFPLTTRSDLRVGAVGSATFGDVRGIDVDRTGRILVLDAQAMELLAFDTTGAPAGVVMKKGEGPSEIAGANGFRLDTLGGIWVNDHGRGSQVTRLKDGQFTTFAMPRQESGFVWEGGVTHDGRIWDFEYRPLAGSDPAPAQNGVVEIQAELFLKKLDPTSGAVDSVSLGTRTLRSVAFPGGTLSIPYVPTTLLAVDPAGAVWTAMADVDRLVKLSGTGDTLVIVELPGMGPPSTPAERAREIEKRTRGLSESGRRGVEAVDWESIIPRNKPVLVNLAVDDQGRVWVQRRTLSRGPVFDVLDANGVLLGSIDPDFDAADHLPPVIRGESFYVVVTDSLDVSSVVRAPVPFR